MLPKWIAKMWPRPSLGLDAVHDSTVPFPVAGAQNPAQSQTIHHAQRGLTNEGAYAFQGYNVGRDAIVTRSLARSMVYTITEAALKIGGPTYPLDFGYGPGAHFDCMTPQFYMRPGIRPLKQAPNNTLGPVTRQI